MSKKIILSPDHPLQEAKVTALTEKVAAHLGLDPADVLVLPSGFAMAVVDVPDAAKVNASPAHSVPTFDHKSEK